VPRLRQASGPPARAASQDVPPAARAGRPVAVMLGVSPDRARSPLQRRMDGHRASSLTAQRPPAGHGRLSRAAARQRQDRLSTHRRASSGTCSRCCH
jgi:hypothetical protein